jgi:hypothetical protein
MAAWIAVAAISVSYRRDVYLRVCAVVRQILERGLYKANNNCGLIWSQAHSMSGNLGLSYVLSSLIL